MLQSSSLGLMLEIPSTELNTEDVNQRTCVSFRSHDILGMGQNSKR